MLKTFLLILSLFIVLLAYNQSTTVQPTTVNPENMSDISGFIELDNQVYKLEIASFNLTSKIIEYKGKAEVVSIPLVSNSEKEVVFSVDNVKLGIKVEEFDSNKHEFKYIDPEAPFLVQIDGKPYWGTDGTLPMSGIGEVTFEFNAKKNHIPASEYKDLFEPILCNAAADIANCFCGAYRSKDRERIYLYMRNGSGTAAYEVTWIFEKGVYKRRVVDFTY